MNTVSPKKFLLLASRIISQLGAARAFSEAEETKLQQVFGLSAEQLTTVIEASTYVFEQAAYFSVSANKLSTQLQNFAVGEGQALAFAQAWSDHGEAYLRKVKSRTLGAPKVLENVNWRLHMALANQTHGRAIDMTSFFDLSTQHIDGTDPETVTFAMNQEQLEHLFTQIETVQAQLDALS
jgi:hypothetical protein